ncbi:TIGR02206 family membrane protein [bacterium]|nr:TIGR02206 family membrane protein [bacterium]
MTNAPFVMFGRQHTLAVAASLACGALLVWAGRRSERVARVAPWGLALACLGCEAYLGLHWQQRGYGWRDLLPLHLCDTTLLLAPIVLVTRNRVCYELLYFLGIPGAVVALATPALHHGYPSAVCLCFFGAHALILTSAVYATRVMRLRPTPGSILRAWGIGTIFAALVAALNPLLGTNYMFLHHKPTTPSLLDALGPWPWYIVAANGIALLAMCVCYAPFLLIDHRASRLDREPPID